MPIYNVYFAQHIQHCPLNVAQNGFSFQVRKWLNGFTFFNCKRKVQEMLTRYYIMPPYPHKTNCKKKLFEYEYPNNMITYQERTV